MSPELGTPSAVPIASDVLGTIGNTPMVELSHVSPNPRVRILVKLESHNPTGSIKDRIAQSMIDDAGSHAGSTT